jgi:hypothetical protein
VNDIVQRRTGALSDRYHLDRELCAGGRCFASRRAWSRRRQRSGTGLTGVASLPILLDMGRLYRMKTTIDIADALLARAKRHAQRSGVPLRAVVEEGLRRVLAAQDAPTAYQLPDLSVGDAQDENPLERMSWPDLRDEIYGGRR